MDFFVFCVHLLFSYLCLYYILFVMMLISEVVYKKVNVIMGRWMMFTSS